MENKNLKTVVAEVKSSTSFGHPLSEGIRDAVLNHDRTKCVAAFAFEDLWDGACGWTRPKDLWDSIVYVWRKAPDFFKEYDPDREIVEDLSRWNQRYFEEQRNYLRHNFCLERLCHLVMIYENLHGAEIGRSRQASDQTGRLHAEQGVCDSRPQHSIRQASPTRTTTARHWYGNVLAVCVVVVVVALLSLLSYQAGWRSGRLSGEEVGKKLYEAWIAQHVCKVSEKVNDDSWIKKAGSVVDTVVDAAGKLIPGKEKKEDDSRSVDGGDGKIKNVQSNDVERTTVVLQKSERADKAPARKPITGVNQKASGGRNE